MPQSNWTILNRLLLSLAAVVMISWAWWSSPRSGSYSPQPLSAGGDFTLQSKAGPISLQAFRGKAVVLYFGFTHCPDVCPTTLKNWAATLESLDKSTRDQVQFLFISIDPNRDTLQWLETYTAYFHHAILGITGSIDELERITELYQVRYAIQPGEDYSVQHTPFVYVLNRQGKIQTMLPHDSAVGGIVDALTFALNKEKSII